MGATNFPHRNSLSYHVNPSNMGGFFSKQLAFDPVKEIPDLSGKVAIVTGGNSGIGFATVQHLARHGAKVYIGARSEERAKAAIERLRAEGLQPGNGEVDWFELDLGDPRKAKQGAEAFLAKEKRLDILVNNAGTMRIPYKINSTYGIQEVMLVNHIGTVLFTRTVLPLLVDTAKQPDSDVRIVVVSSDAMRRVKGHDVHFRDINDINNEFKRSLLPDFDRYGLSKLANTLFAKQLQRKLDEEGAPIIVTSLHPGSVFTEGVQKDPTLTLPIIKPITTIILRQFFLSPSGGAYNSLFAAASPIVKAEKEKYKGAYLRPPAGTIVPPPAPQAESKELAEELWNTTEAILKTFNL